MDGIASKVRNVPRHPVSTSGSRARAALPLEGWVPTRASPVVATPAALRAVKDAVILIEQTQLASRYSWTLMEAQEGRGGGTQGLAWWVSTGRRSVSRSHTPTDRWSRLIPYRPLWLNFTSDTEEMIS